MTKKKYRILAIIFAIAGITGIVISMVSAGSGDGHNWALPIGLAATAISNLMNAIGLKYGKDNNENVEEM